MELEELIKSIDIVEFLSQFVELEEKGDEWWGLSCFKEEKTPSFSVRRDPPVWFYISYIFRTLSKHRLYDIQFSPYLKNNFQLCNHSRRHKALFVI